jgi:pimeloyl-ACP methyl ester carboxylesterase
MNTIELGAGRALTYTDTGHGPTLVLLHAFPLDREMWQPQLAVLGGKSRVLAVDLPGFGGSSPAPFTVDSAADLVVTLLDKLGVSGTVTVGGLSMGGYVALAFARRHAGRLAGLILADTKAEADDEAGRQNREKMLVLAQEQGTAGVVEQMIPKLLSESTRATRADVVETVRRIGLRQPAEGIRNAIVALRDRPDAAAGLGTIAVPTLVLVGEHDAVTPPAAAAAIAGRVPDSRVVTIPAAGHLSNLENPAAFNGAIITFLSNLTRP